MNGPCFTSDGRADHRAAKGAARDDGASRRVLRGTQQGGRGASFWVAGPSAALDLGRHFLYPKQLGRDSRRLRAFTDAPVVPSRSVIAVPIDRSRRDLDK